MRNIVKKRFTGSSSYQTRYPVLPLSGGQVYLLDPTLVIPRRARAIDPLGHRPLAQHVLWRGDKDFLAGRSIDRSFVPGYEASAWYWVGVPQNTPTEIIGKLNGEINAALDDSKVKARLAHLGGTELAGPLADFGKLIAEETRNWAKVIKFAGVRPQ